MAVAILPILSVGLLAPLLLDDLEISKVDLGLLVSLASGTSAVLSPSAGTAVDRVGARRALLLALGAGTLSLSLMAGASGYAGLAAALAVAGLCHAASNPSTNRVISDWLPPGQRGSVTGIKQAGETIAIIGASAVLP